MDTLYSEPFEYSTATDINPQGVDEAELYSEPNEFQAEVANQNWRPRYGGAGRSTAIRRKSNSAAQQHDDMGQSDSTPKYMEVFNDPSQPTLQNVHRLNSRGLRVSEEEEVMMRRGHQNEDSNEYCYASGIVEHRHGPPMRTVSLKDDYSQPHDRLSGVRHDSQDYTEPYQSEAQGQGHPQQQVVPENTEADGFTYELAKDVSELHVQGPAHKRDTTVDQYSHLSTATPNRPAGADCYDHTETWLSRTSAGNASEPTSKKQPFSVREGARSDDPLRRGSAGSQASAMQGRYEDIPPSYEDPWDTGEGGKKLSILLEKAEKRDSQRKSVDQNPPQQRLTSPMKSPNRHAQMISPGGLGYVNTQAVQSDMDNGVYESAWETHSGVPKMTGDQGMGHCNEDSSQYQVPISPPVSAQSKKHIPPNYEEAWDTPMKQAEFEHKLSQARKERVSKGQIAADELDRVKPDSDRVRAPEERCPTAFGPTSPTRSKNRSDQDFGRSESSRSMAAIAEKINKDIPLEEQIFYHGTIKRYDAERKLLVFKEGSYIIRRSESNKRDYSLTLKGWDGTPMHMKIACKADGTFVLGENSPPFTTIPEMVDYYTTHQLPVQNADRICLLHPVPS